LALSNLSLQQLAAALGGDVSGSQVLAPGPGHSAKDRSMAVKLTTDGYTVHSHAGDDWKACRDHIDERIGAPKWEPQKQSDPTEAMSAMARKSKQESDMSAQAGKSTAANYVNCKADGTPRLRVNRTATKGFWQEHWEGDRFVKGAGTEPHVPYKLPELLKYSDAPVLIVEGEKDVENVMDLGLVATTNAGGAGNWHADLNQYFSGRDVFILPDNDEAGEAHAHKVHENLNGAAREIRILRLPGLGDKQDVSDWIAAGGTQEQLVDLLKAAPKYEEAPPKTEQPADTIPDMGIWDAGDDLEMPEPRHWLLGNQFCRKFLSGILAPGSTGKTSLRTLQCLSLATGRKLTGQHVFKRSRVMIVSLEDDKDELRRRLKAACIHYNIKPTDLKGWLFCAAPKGFKLAEMKNGSRQIGMLEKMLRRDIEKWKPDLLSLDPFIKLHALEENDNGAMDFVCDLLVQLAIEYDIAVDAPHHTKKGNVVAGDADAGRGASAARDAGRLIYTLTRMTEEEAKTFGVKAEERNLYVRLDSGKVNLARPSGEATWFKLIGVQLGNGNADYPAGDEVQTVVPWHPPKTWDGITTDQVNAALNEIDAGMPNGQRYSTGGKAKERAAWPVVQRHCPSKTEHQCREMVGTWVKSGLLYADEYDDPIARKRLKGLKVDNSKRPS
jgi:hypothetical protein